jgi:accessory gene regulator B
MHLGVIITITTTITLLITAPEGLKGYSKIPEKYYIILKYLSVLVVLSNLYFEFSTVAVAFLVQAINTTKLGYTLTTFIDRIANHTLGKEVRRHET